MKLEPFLWHLLLVVLLSTMLGMSVTSTVAEDEEYIHSLEVSVSPEFPTIDDEVNVTISFVAASKDFDVSQSPHCGDFVILIPSNATPPEANYTFICHLGKLPAGQHDFEVYIAICFCIGDTCTLPMPYLTETTSFTVTYPGDIDLDYDVDWVDRGLFGDAYLSPPRPNYNILADLDRDGDVDWIDRGYFGDNYLTGVE